MVKKKTTPERSKPKGAPAAKKKRWQGRSPGDAIAGDKILVRCRKPGQWASFRMSEQHHGFETTAMMNASAQVIYGYKNIRI